MKTARLEEKMGFKDKNYVEKGHNMRLSKFMYETVSGGFTSQLPISSVCNARCIFCSNNMNPFPIYREGFRPLEDVKKGIALLDPSAPHEIRLGDSLPGRISEGEALLHPDIFEIFQLIREKFKGRTIQINTNGTMLTKEFVEKLVPFKPIKLSISYHSDNPEYWCKIFKLKQEEYKIARNSFFYLQKYKFLIEGVIVPLPKLVGYADIENTIKNIRPFSDSILIYSPGFSKKASIELKKIMNVDFGELSSFFMKMRKKYNVNLTFLTDPLMPLDFFPYNIMKRTFYSKFQKVLWLFSEAAYDRGEKILKDYDKFTANDHFGIMVKNYTYLGNIICAGLLMVSDFQKAVRKALEQLSKLGVKIDLMILPKIAFDRFGDDLKGNNYSKLADEFNIPIWLE